MGHRYGSLPCYLCAPSEQVNTANDAMPMLRTVSRVLGVLAAVVIGAGAGLAVFLAYVLHLVGSES